MATKKSLATSKEPVVTEEITEVKEEVLEAKKPTATLVSEPNPAQSFSEYTIKGTGADPLLPVNIVLADPSPSVFFTLWAHEDGSFTFKRLANQSAKYKVEAYQRNNGGHLQKLAEHEFPVIDSELFLGGKPNRPTLTAKRDGASVIVKFTAENQYDNLFIEVENLDKSFDTWRQVRYGNLDLGGQDIVFENVPSGSTNVRLRYPKYHGGHNVWPILLEVAI